MNATVPERPEPRALVLMRHGRTAWNAAGRIQGQLDAPLDETGLAQAAAAAPVVAGLRPALIWASDLSRAAVTADRVAEVAGLEVRHDPRLREMHFGDRQGSTHADWRRERPEQFEAVFRDGDYRRIPGGEKPEELGGRVAEALGELLERTPDGGVSLAVSHGLAIKFGLGAMLGWDEETILSLGHLDNCAWSALVIESDGRRRLAWYNRVAG